MAKSSSATLSLLACGVVAGPTYVIATLVQALTRDGFDITHHRFTQLTTGELGWIHQSNMVLVGVLTVLFAFGLSQRMRLSKGMSWGPPLLALFGLSYIIGGLLTADATLGFPPGTSQDMVQTTLQGQVQNASRSVSTVLLIATSLVIARWFSADGRIILAWVYGTSIPIVFIAIIAAGSAIDFNSGGLAYLATPWIWVTALALTFYGSAAQHNTDLRREQDA